MIPEFPQFKTLELADKEAVEAFTKKFPPYSDFNFVSMWSWDIKGEMKVSQLNNNLVVRFTDYLTGNPFFSFLGDNKVNETVEALLEFSKKERLNPELKLIPEESTKELDLTKFKAKEDMDHNDYIFDLNHISEYSGGQFSKKRNKVRQLLKLFPEIKVEIIDIRNEDIKDKILKLEELWLHNKNKKDLEYDIKNEFLAANRFFKLNFDDIFSVGVFLDKELIGYSIVSVEPKNYVISHFTKANIKYGGIYDFLMQEFAKILIQKKYFFMNYEQDLGLSGLRDSKKSFMSKLLKKYTISFTH